MNKRKTAESGDVQEEQTTEQKSQADQLWNKIKNLDLELYALPDQKVHKHCKRFDIMPDCLHLKITSTAVLPALEELLMKVRLAPEEKFEITQAGPYTVVKVVPKY
jgi:hypothetical protein